MVLPWDELKRGRSAQRGAVQVVSVMVLPWDELKLVIRPAGRRAAVVVSVMVLPWDELKRRCMSQGRIGRFDSFSDGFAVG